jgi:hypothetical protein
VSIIESPKRAIFKLPETVETDFCAEAEAVGEALLVEMPETAPFSERFAKGETISAVFWFFLTRFIERMVMAKVKIIIRKTKKALSFFTMAIVSQKLWMAVAGGESSVGNTSQFAQKDTWAVK